MRRLGELALSVSPRDGGAGDPLRVLVVSDPGVVAAGHAARGMEALEAAGLRAFLFDGARENPTTEHVDCGVVFAREHRIELIVGLGGGSSMDCAKGINFLLSNGGRMADYRGVGKAVRPMLPLVAVPTTAGTGSEAQSFALIADAATHRKMACGDRKAAARVAILDPELTVTQPRHVTVAAGLDAIAHALESYVSTKANPISRMFSREAWRLLSGAFERVLRDPGDLDARGAMLLGANFAGAAIENSMLGAAHACANPLTARFDITHGIAVSTMLPHVIRFNAAAVNGEYAALTDAREHAADAVAALVERFNAAGDLPPRLREHGVPKDAIAALAADAATQWTGGFNPRRVSERDFVELYEAAW